MNWGKLHELNQIKYILHLLLANVFSLKNWKRNWSKACLINSHNTLLLSFIKLTGNKNTCTARMHRLTSAKFYFHSVVIGLMLRCEGSSWAPPGGGNVSWSVPSSEPRGEAKKWRRPLRSLPERCPHSRRTITHGWHKRQLMSCTNVSLSVVWPSTFGLQANKENECRLVTGKMVRLAQPAASNWRRHTLHDYISQLWTRNWPSAFYKAHVSL